MTLTTHGDTSASGQLAWRDDTSTEELDFAVFCEQVTPELYRHLFSEDRGDGLNLPVRRHGASPRVARRAWFTGLSSADVPIALRPLADWPYPPAGLETELVDGRGERIRLHADGPGRAVVGRSLRGDPCFAMALDEPPGGGGDLYLIRFVTLRHLEAGRAWAEIANLMELVQVTIARPA